MPESEADVMSEDSVQIEVENNCKSTKQDIKVFNKVNYYYSKQLF